MTEAIHSCFAVDFFLLPSASISPASTAMALAADQTFEKVE